MLAVLVFLETQKTTSITIELKSTVILCISFNFLFDLKMLGTFLSAKDCKIIALFLSDTKIRVQNRSEIYLLDTLTYFAPKIIHCRIAESVHLLQ